MVNNLSDRNEILIKQLNDEYVILSEDIKHQISFIGDYYEFDVDHLIKTLNDLKKAQDKIKSNRA